MENEKEAETGWVLLKRRDILKGFDGNVEKTDKIIAKRTQQGKWAKDDDFPDDEEEHQYWMKVKTGLTHRERAVDAIEAASKMEVDDDDAKALLNPGGILAQGNMPMGGPHEAGGRDEGDK